MHRARSTEREMHTTLLSNLVITKVFTASTFYSPQNKKGRRNNRSQWALVIKYEGETTYLSEGKRYLSDLNHVVILPKGCSYEWHCTKTGHFTTIEFESELTAKEPLTFFVKNGEHILKMFKALEHSRNLKKPLMELESIREVYTILLALAKSEQEQYLPTEKQKKILPALEYISTHYHERITNDDLAALTGLSTVYFRKLFTGVMGVSPIVYVQRVRIEKAKEMLQSDYGTLSDVAQSLGYLNLYDFSRDFKKHTGVSPSRYRESEARNHGEANS